MNSIELYQAPESHPVVRGSTRRCTHSCAQLAVSKLLWDLYCRNALVGNSSLSFIFFVCIKFPTLPPIHSHIQFPALSIYQWTHFVSADLVLAAAITSEQGPSATGELFHLPSASPQSADRAPEGCVFYCIGKQKEAKTNAVPYFSRPLRPLLAPPGWGVGGLDGGMKVN